MRFSKLPALGLCLLMVNTGPGSARAEGAPADLRSALTHRKGSPGGPVNMRGAAQGPYELHVDFTREPPLEQVVWHAQGTGSLSTEEEVTAAQRQVLLEALSRVELPPLAPLSGKLTGMAAGEEWQREMWRQYREWLGREPLTRADRTQPHLTAEDRREMALRVALEHVLEGMGEEALRWLQPEQLAFIVVASATAYLVLAALPEPISKGVVMYVTYVLVAAFGVDVVLHVLAEWRGLTEATERARTFAEIQAAGARFGKQMGNDGTRMMLTLAALWAGRGGLAKGGPQAAPTPSAAELARFSREAGTLLKKLAPGTAPAVVRAAGPRGQAPVALGKVESITLEADRVVFAVKATTTTSALYAARRSQGEQSSSEDPSAPDLKPAPQDAQETPIDEALFERIRAALQGCADKAYHDMLRKHRGGRRPTDAECDQLVTNARGERVSLAVWLGSLMHDEAKRCAEESLGQLKPGGFSTNPRYRRVPKDPAKKHPDPKNPDDWRTEWISSQEEALMPGAEKLGTIVPDIVIHDGHPLLVQRVFDYKFPCKSGRTPVWRKYPPGHPYQDRLQEEVYKDFLKARPQSITPKR